MKLVVNKRKRAACEFMEFLSNAEILEVRVFTNRTVDKIPIARL